MVDRTTSNQQGEIAKPSGQSTGQSTGAGQPIGQPNTVKRNDGPTQPTDTTATSEPMVEQDSEVNDSADSDSVDDGADDSSDTDDTDDSADDD